MIPPPSPTSGFKPRLLRPTRSTQSESQSGLETKPPPSSWTTESTACPLSEDKQPDTPRTLAASSQASSHSQIRHDKSVPTPTGAGLDSLIASNVQAAAHGLSEVAGSLPRAQAGMQQTEIGSLPSPVTLRLPPPILSLDLSPAPTGADTKPQVMVEDERGSVLQQMVTSLCLRPSLQTRRRGTDSEVGCGQTGLEELVRSMHDDAQRYPPHPNLCTLQPKPSRSRHTAHCCVAMPQSLEYLV